jgi:hypothetical protein
MELFPKHLPYSADFILQEGGLINTENLCCRMTERFRKELHKEPERAGSDYSPDSRIKKTEQNHPAIRLKGLLISPGGEP